MLGVSVGSTIISSIMAAKAAKAQARAEQAAAEYNAVLAEMEGNAEYRRQRRYARRSLSSQFVQMAGKSGVIAEEGGWLERLVQNAAEYETNALNAAIAGRNTARLNRAHGANAIRQGNQMAGASLLAGAGKIAGMAYSLYGTGKTAKPAVEWPQ
jgi:predicted polyphosphate/ATP-dependent NAD kinase